MASVRTISERAQAETTLTLKVTRAEQERLANEMTLIHIESQKLRRLVIEAVEGVNSIVERAQSGTVRLIKEAHQQEEHFGLAVERLFATPLDGDAQDAQANAIRERAANAAAQVEQEARNERAQLLAEVASLRAESAALQRAMAAAMTRAQAIVSRTHSEAERLVGDDAPPAPESGDNFLLFELAGSAQEATPPSESGRAPSNGHHAASSNGKGPRTTTYNEETVLQRAREAIAAAQLPDPGSATSEEWTGPLLLSVSGTTAGKPSAWNASAEAPHGKMHELLTDTGSLILQQSPTVPQRLAASFATLLPRRKELAVIGLITLLVFLTLILLL